MRKETKAEHDFYYSVGKTICKAFAKQLSHPYIKIDMCPDFDNLLILTFGRFIYKFLNSKKGIKLWKEVQER